MFLFDYGLHFIWRGREINIKFTIYPLKSIKFSLKNGRQIWRALYEIPPSLEIKLIQIKLNHMIHALENAIP